MRLAPGKRADVELALNKAGKALLKDKGKLGAAFEVIPNKGAEAIFSKKVALKSA